MNRGGVTASVEARPGSGAAGGATLRSRLWRGGSLLSMAEGVTFLLRFARSIILARLLSPADFGIAATFVMTVQFLEMLSDLGADKLLVQCESGAVERMQRISQLVAALRGLVAAGMIFMSAGLLAALFRSPQATDGFRLLAVVPVLHGLQHLDLVRRQREMSFGPWVSAQLAAGAVATLAAWPLAMYFRSWWALLWMLVIDATVLLAISHMLSERPYRWGWGGPEMRRLLRFGWPLLANGLLMFGIFQGDQLIVAVFYSMGELGIYAVAFAVAMLPASMVTRTAASLLLPAMAGLRDDRPRFENAYRILQQGLSLVAGWLAMLLIVAGPVLVTALYGRKYAAAGVLAGWLGAMQAIRLLRVGPTLGALANGDTWNSLMANIFRTLALPLSLGAALSGAPLVWIAAAGIVGEALAYIAAVFGAHRRHKLAARSVVRPVLFGCAAVVAALGARELAGGAWTTVLPVAAALMVVAPAVAVMVMFPELRRAIVLPACRSHGAS